MRSLETAALNALAERQIVFRRLVWFKAMTRDNPPAPEPAGFCNDVRPITTNVIDGDTGDSVSRTFYAAGSLISVEGLSGRSDMSVPQVEIRLSHVNTEVINAVRAYSVRQVPVETYLALFDPATRSLVATPRPDFMGFVDEPVIHTGADGEESYISLICVSHSRELTRFNTDTRSNASQWRRDETDNFFADATVVSDWPIYWGVANGRIKPDGYQFNRALAQ